VNNYNYKHKINYKLVTATFKAKRYSQSDSHRHVRMGMAMWHMLSSITLIR